MIAAIGTVLASAYLLWLYQRTVFGEPTAEFGGHGGPDVPLAHSLSAAANADPHGDVHDHHSTGHEHGDAHGADIRDVSPVEWIAWAPILIAIVVFGVFPQLMFKVMDPAVTQLVDRLGAGIP